MWRPALSAFRARSRPVASSAARWPSSSWCGTRSEAGVRAYAFRLGVDPYGWLILSGSAATTQELRDRFGRFGLSPGEPPGDTRGRVFLVDYAGRVRRVFEPGAFQPDAVLADLERLL